MSVFSWLFVSDLCNLSDISLTSKAQQSHWIQSPELIGVIQAEIDRSIACSESVSSLVCSNVCRQMAVHTSLGLGSSNAYFNSQWDLHL